MSPIAKSPALVHDHPASVETDRRSPASSIAPAAERSAWPAPVDGDSSPSAGSSAPSGSPPPPARRPPSSSKGSNASPFQFGVLAALPFIASLLSLPASLLIERTGERKKIFLYGLYFQRLLWFPIALVPLWIVSQYGPARRRRGDAVFLLLMFIMHAAGAVGGPAWVSWMADVVPERLRGKYFSRRRQWGIVSAIPTALLVGWLLDRCCRHGATR